MKAFAKLAQKKYRREEGLVLVEGASIIEELLKSGYPVAAVLFDAERVRMEKMLSVAAEAQKAGVYAALLDEKDLRRLSSTESPPAVVAVASEPKWDVEFSPPEDAIAVVIEGVQDPNNVGAILRTSAAFGACAVYAVGGSCDLTNPRVIRGSMGAAFRIPSFRTGNLSETAEILKKKGFRLLGAAASGGTDYRKADLSGKIAVCVGNEARGLAGSEYDALVTIPIAGAVESLNVAVALGVFLAAVRGMK
jgi:TrmH family RNA methyltransferase